MDCCNYVQPYSGHGHFYQQHHFCYDNMNGYAAYGTAPISDAIETNRRYATLQAAASYPTDYVYNPKEARLRKAMREQSRELSRQSILQAAVASSSENNSSATNGCNTNNIRSRISTGGDGVGADDGDGGGSDCGNGDISVSRNYLNHPMTCASPAPPAVTASSLPGNSTYNPNRIANPWFPVGHTPSTNHMKPMLPHRVMQAHQQRTFDKTKEVLRKQTECAGAFSTASGATGSCYPGDFTVHGAPTQPTSDTSASGLESNDYCGIGEFTDGQKWHPYQSTATSYHTRNGPMPKMMNRHGMQNINPHGHTSWNQFCGVPLFSMAPQSSMIRGPRHMVFMHDQQERHCGFATDEIPMAYMPNKMDIGHRLQSGYSQSNYQETEKCIEDAPRWEAPTPICPPHLSTINNHTVTQQRDTESRIKEPHQHQHPVQQQPQQQQPLSKKEDTKEYTDNNDFVEHQRPSTKTPCKQPLPGFHQAFGSTEIGRFSRSEFFANMVGENGGGNGVSGVSINGNSSSSSSIDTIERISLRIRHHNSVTSCSNNNNNNIEADNCVGDGLIVDTADNYSSLTNITAHRNDVRNTMPRWHSPYVSAIGSEI
ncbi:hypothetical protein PV327_010485 [Microctonus hyperodae]|uniref:Uncharacterized protein n=1 Tax=Microctonus hyperodae TaxID=165561 RepID=A0AA39FSK2_MICHY|nr:hypothetical protein PV327_010485 [Microctonus hyperodae]